MVPAVVRRVGKPEQPKGGSMVFKLISELDDKSAAGIVKAADENVIASGDVRYSAIISSARSLVEKGMGHHVYIGSHADLGPMWDDPDQPGVGPSGR